ncbi:MAG: PAS domain-containing protein [Planctomycetota bacterium]|jgi:PAS domain S-box-containing protein
MVFGKFEQGKIAIDDHKQVEQLLQHLGMIVEQVDQGVVVTDLKGVIHFANTAWARMHGYGKSGELLGLPISTFFTKEQMRKEVLALIGKAKRKGQLTQRMEHVRKDGTAVATYTKMAAAKDDRGRPVGVIILASDVAAREQAEEGAHGAEQRVGELAAANKKLRQELAELKVSRQGLTADWDDDEEPEMGIEPFRPEKLKALSDLAKRLSSE